MASAMQQLAMGDHHAASRGIEIDTGRQFAHWSPTAHCVGQEPVASWEHQSAAVRLSDRCDRRKDIHRLRGFGVGPYALVLVKCLRHTAMQTDGCDQRGAVPSRSECLRHQLLNNSVALHYVRVLLDQLLEDLPFVHTAVDALAARGLLSDAREPLALGLLKDPCFDCVHYSGLNRIRNFAVSPFLEIRAKLTDVARRLRQILILPVRVFVASRSVVVAAGSVLPRAPLLASLRRHKVDLWIVRQKALHWLCQQRMLGRVHLLIRCGERTHVVKRELLWHDLGHAVRISRRSTTQALPTYLPAGRYALAPAGAPTIDRRAVRGGREGRWSSPWSRAAVVPPALALND